MAKWIILYNLSENITHEEFKEYVLTDKGPLINSLPAVNKYELVKITGSMSGQIPYQYAGIVDVTSLEEFDQKATPTPEYQAFLKKFGPMAKDMLMLSGEELYSP